MTDNAKELLEELKTLTNKILLDLVAENEELEKQLENKSRWIPVEKCGYPKPEDEYKHFLTIDNKGEITIQEFLLSLDEEPQPYFTGMRNIVAWQPLPEPYKAEKEKGGE